MRREAKIQEHNLRLFLCEPRERGRAILRFGDFEILCQRPFQLRADFLIIINNQNYWLQCVPSFNGSTMRKVVPSPFFESTSILPPCASTIILLWNMPMPIPFFLVV